MDATITRRVTAIGLALTAIATVYAVTTDLIKAAIALVVALPFLLWGFWPRRSGSQAVPPPATLPKAAAPSSRIGAKIGDLESVRIRAVLRGLSVGALNELVTLLGTDPPKSIPINLELLNLLNSGLIGSAGPGSNFGECVFYIQPAAEEIIREFFKERAAKRRIAATVKTDKDKT